MPPMITIASSSPENATEIGSAEVIRLLNSSSMPASPVSAAETTKARQLVALGRVAEEARALLVLADRDQHAAERRAVEAPEEHDHARSRWRRRARSSASRCRTSSPRTSGATMPPSPFSPPVTSVQRKATEIQHRGEREREQREVHAAPPQDQEAEAPRPRRRRSRGRTRAAAGTSRGRARAARSRRRRRPARTRRRGRRT